MTIAQAPHAPNFPDLTATLPELPTAPRVLQWTHEALDLTRSLFTATLSMDGALHHCVVEAAGALQALTAMLADLGRPMELVTFRQRHSITSEDAHSLRPSGVPTASALPTLPHLAPADLPEDAAATYVQCDAGGHTAWALGLGRTADESARNAVLAAAGALGSTPAAP